MPSCRRIPSVSDLPATCSRSAEAGTSTSNRSGRSASITASIVSVLPVPVGITTTPGSVTAVDQ